MAAKKKAKPGKKKRITDPRRLLAEGVDVVGEVRKTHERLRKEERGFIHPEEGSFLAHARIGDEVVTIPRDVSFIGPEHSRDHIRHELKNLAMIQDRQAELREEGGPRLRLMPVSLAVRGGREKKVELGKTMLRSGEEIDEKLISNIQRWSKHMDSAEERLGRLRGKARKDKARELFADALRQLSALHNLGVAHADIDKRHVRVDKDGKVRLMDWARAVDLDKLDDDIRPLRMSLDLVHMRNSFMGQFPLAEMDKLIEKHYFKNLGFEAPKEAIRRSLSNRNIRMDPHERDGAG